MVNELRTMSPTAAPTTQDSSRAKTGEGTVHTSLAQRRTSKQRLRLMVRYHLTKEINKLSKPITRII